MYGLAHSPLRFGMLFAVRTLDDMAELIKEAEVTSGAPGREFMYAEGPGEVRHWITHRGGFWVVDGRTALASEALLATAVGRALQDGRLFTAAV